MVPYRGEREMGWEWGVRKSETPRRRCGAGETDAVTDYLFLDLLLLDLLLLVLEPQFVETHSRISVGGETLDTTP